MTDHPHAPDPRTPRERQLEERLAEAEARLVANDQLAGGGGVVGANLVRFNGVLVALDPWCDSRYGFLDVRQAPYGRAIGITVDLADTVRETLSLLVAGQLREGESVGLLRFRLSRELFNRLCTELRVKPE